MLLPLFSRFLRTKGQKRLSALFFLAVAICIVSLAVLFGGHSSSMQTSPSNLLGGQWSYLPGTSVEGGIPHINAIQFGIVQQDGSGSQANHPINVFGTHLENATDFSISARLEGVNGRAGLQLYGQLPIIADEFRVERKSLRLNFDKGTLEISIWDGTRQTPATSKSISLKAQDTFYLEIRHSADTITILVDGQTITKTDAQDVFQDGNVWLGLDADRSLWRLTSLSANGLNDKTFAVIDGSKLRAANSGSNSLQELADQKRPGFTIGAAVALNPAVSDQEYAQIAFGDNFGAITPENAMKWQFLEPRRGLYSFKETDALVTLAERHGMKVQGHALVFGEANPAWLKDVPAEELEQTMLKHIADIVGRYKVRVATWDVVNEPFDDEEWSSLRKHIWYQAMGESYISKAFYEARRADPNALLFVNDYGLEEDGERWDAFLSLITKLKHSGVPIDGVGFQAHVYEAGDKIDPAVLRRHIRQLAQIGVKSRISEMDVYDDDGTAEQAKQYSNVFNACLSEPNCISWTTWGVSDRYDFFTDDDGSIQQGHDFLWDENMKPTPALSAIINLLSTR